MKNTLTRRDENTNVLVDFRFRIGIQGLYLTILSLGCEPAGIRTQDTRIKSPMLCQTELPAHENIGGAPTNLYRRIVRGKV